MVTRLQYVAVEEQHSLLQLPSQLYLGMLAHSDTDTVQVVAQP